MKWPAVLSIWVLLAASVPALAEQNQPPVVQSEPAQVTIDPLPEGRRLIRLPAIELSLRLAPACTPDLALQSLSISIADTRHFFHAADFELQPVIETRLKIPGRQIGPIGIDEFCVAGESSSPATKQVADAFTANVSVRCGNDSTQLVTYDTLALAIVLMCQLPVMAPESIAPTAPGDRDVEPDQDSSSATRF